MNKQIHPQSSSAGNALTAPHILQHVKIQSALEQALLFRLFYNQNRNGFMMNDDNDESFTKHGRFGRKPRLMSGMAASLLRARTFQDTQQTKGKPKQRQKA